MAVAHVPDPRLDKLTAMFKPKKHTPAIVKFVDVPGVTKGGAEPTVELRQMDGLAVVVRGFKSEEAPHPEGSVDPARDLELLETEMLLWWISVVTNRRQRVKDLAKKKTPSSSRRRPSLPASARRSTKASPLGRSKSRRTRKSSCGASAS